MSRPLEGIRIIELGMGWAGPLCCRHLADLGAEVIKVEGCSNFDWWRSWEATSEWIADNGAEKSTAFNTVNRNKLGVTLDLQHPDGRDLLLKLAGESHGVVENFSVETLPKLKLEYSELKKANDSIILLSMPAFGATGPWSSFRAYGSTVEQASGLPHLNGSPVDPPVMQHIGYGDAVAGLAGASSMLTALWHQEKKGEGQFVELSHVEAMHILAAHGILEFATSGLEPVRCGNESALSAPHGVYPCKDLEDGTDVWIVIQVFDETQWKALRELAQPRFDKFGSLESRIESRETLDTLIGTWTSQQDGRELMYLLQSQGIPSAVTNTASDLLVDDHLTETSFWKYKERPYVGSQPNPAAGYRLEGQPYNVELPAPTLGQHNEEVLSGILGLSIGDLERLERAGVIGTRPVLKKEA